MKKFNLVDEIIDVPQVDFISAVNRNSEFGITTDGEIVYPPYSAKKVYIFKGVAAKSSAVSATPVPITQALGKYYTVSLNGPKLSIKASMAWQDIIGLNIDAADYDDTTGDGISHFTDKELEDMGWHATEFDINYRSLVEELESKVDGMLFCIEREEPYQFSGMGFIDDIEKARKILKNYIVKEIKEKMKNNPDFSDAMIDEDQEEALEYFGITVKV